MSGEDALKDRETPLLKKRLWYSLGFLILLMYLSMGHMMWNWPVPGVLADNHVAMGLIQLLLTAAIMVINQKFFISGFKSLFHGAPNMDTLVALGAGAAFVYSTYALFAMTDAQVRGDMAGVMTYMHEFCFESAATVNQSGFIRCEATRVGEDTTLSQIIKMVSDAAATKAPLRKWRIRCRVCLSRLLSSLPSSLPECGCLSEKESVLRWQEASPCW